MPKVLKLEEKKFYKNSVGYGTFTLILFGLTYDDGSRVKGLLLYWSRILRVLIPCFYVIRIVLMTKAKLEKCHNLSDIVQFHGVWQIVACLIIYINFLVKHKLMVKLGKVFRYHMPAKFDDQYLWYIPFLCVFFGQLIIDFSVWSYLKSIDSSFGSDEEKIFTSFFQFLPREGILFGITQSLRILLFCVTLRVGSLPHT